MIGGLRHSFRRSSLYLAVTTESSPSFLFVIEDPWRVAVAVFNYLFLQGSFTFLWSLFLVNVQILSLVSGNVMLRCIDLPRTKGEEWK